MECTGKGASISPANRRAAPSVGDRRKGVTLMKEPDGCHAGPAAWLCGGGTLLGEYSELWNSPGMQRNDWSGSPWRAVMDCFRPVR